MKEERKAQLILQAIRDNKWLRVKYFNKHKNISFFSIYIKSINAKNKLFICDCFNSEKENAYDKDFRIYFDFIKEVDIVEYLAPLNDDNSLYDEIIKNKSKYKFLFKHDVNKNLFNYFSDCYNLDLDPRCKYSTMIDGIDKDVLENNKVIKLTDTQNNKIINFLGNLREKNRFISHDLNNLCFSLLAIDQGNKMYVVFYYEVLYNPQSKTIKISPELKLNKEFVIEGCKNDLYRYFDVNMSLDKFLDMASKNFDDAISYIKEQMYNYYDRINTKPIFYIQTYERRLRLNDLFTYIQNGYKTNDLYPPLLAFLGIYQKEDVNENYKLCLVDQNYNDEQLKVVFNSLTKQISIVQGPPGTGKTKTIVNIAFSNFISNRKVLICSSNNIPVDGVVGQLNFSYNGKKVSLPFLRLGSSDYIDKAINKIRNIFEYVQTKNNVYLSSGSDLDLKFSKLSNNLINIEEKENLEDTKNKCEEIFSSLNINKKSINKKIKKNILNLNKKIIKIEKNINDNVEIPILSDSLYIQKYYNDTVLYYLEKLKNPIYDELRKIVFNDDIETTRKDFNNYLKNPDKLNLLTDIFPIILTTNVSSDRIGFYDNKMFTFDLVVIDESSQCDIVRSLLPISRGKNLVLVGDPNQLKPVILMNSKVNSLLMKKYDISECYNYCKKSILDCILDLNGKLNFVMLKNHYRCGKNIINFSNERYYESKLSLDHIKSLGKLEFIDTKNTYQENKNEALEEAKHIVEKIKENKINDAMIITPFVNQKNLLEKLLKEDDLDRKISVGTIHSLQGQEKDTIILSTAISQNTSRQTYDWIKNNKELINVAVTRAKNRLILAADSNCIDALSDKTDDLYVLKEYVKSNGEKVKINPVITYVRGKSNGSKNENEFYKTIKQFCTVEKSYKVKRNVPFSEIFADDKILSKTKFEFDVVLYEKKSLFSNKPVCVFEINGVEHINNKLKEFYDKEKREVCKSKNIELIVISNKEIKEYELIKKLILSKRKI